MLSKKKRHERRTRRHTAHTGVKGKKVDDMHRSNTIGRGKFCLMCITIFGLDLTRHSRFDHLSMASMPFMAVYKSQQTRLYFLSYPPLLLHQPNSILLFSLSLSFLSKASASACKVTPSNLRRYIPLSHAGIIVRGKEGTNVQV